MTIMASQRTPAPILIKFGRSLYEVWHPTTKKFLGRVVRKDDGRSWEAWIAVYEFGQNTRCRPGGKFRTRRDAVAELWIERDELATG
jgi:hypothetical protein